MGNPLVNSTERAELPVLPNFDEPNARSGNLMRDEVYAPKDLKETKERVQVSAQQVEQRLNQLFGHLENAQTLFAQGDARNAVARKEYVAAIASADEIDQTSVARELRNIKLILANQNLDLQTRRLLVQEDADLHTLQRAPGFARANLALALIRNGDHLNGTQLLLEAQQRDRLMLGDPNFQRHLKTASDGALQNANFNVEPREEKRSTPPLPPPPEVKRTDSDKLTTDNATERQTSGSETERRTQGNATERHTPATVADHPTLTPGSAAAALVDVQQKFRKVFEENGDVKAAYQQLQPKFLAAMQQADAEFGKVITEKTTQPDHQAKVSDALMGRFLTRFHLADAAITAGDQKNAHSHLASAFEAVPPDLQNYFAVNKPEVEILARKVGLDLRLLPAPLDETLAKALSSAPLGKAGASDIARSDATTTTTTDATQPPVPGISPENEGLRADQIFDDARRSLQQVGMNDETKKLFADAIKVADSMYGSADQQATDNLIKSLQTGLKPGGIPMTAADRLEVHKVMQQEFSRATLGMQYRMVYAQALNQNKQYASAEKVLLENIAITDKLPLTSFQAELTQLGKDVQDPNISRNSQRDLFKMMQALQGQGTSKDDGLLFMPITSRKQAAYFYVGGADGSGVGVVKPEQASAMIDDAIAKEVSLYGVERDRVKIFDPSLASMAQGVLPLLPENVRNMKMKADSFWSNALVDGGVAAMAISGTMFVAGVLTRNGTLAKMGLVSGEGTLNLGGKALVGASILGGATLGRHEAHRMITGENEGWDKSLIHGTAGVGEVAAIMGTRSLANKILYGGANVTPEAMLTRFSSERSIAAVGERAATTPTVGEFFVHMGSNGRRLTAEQAALRSSAAPLLEAGIVNAEAASALGNLTRPQLANLTQTFIGEGAAGSRWYTPRGLYAGSKNLIPGSLDLTTATSGNLGVRSFYGGYAGAFNAVGTYSSISSLDRGIDPNTGELMSYADSLIKSNYRSNYDNTATNALFMGLFMRDGALATNVYAEGAGRAAKIRGYLKAPLKPSALPISALGEGASYGQIGLKSGQLGIISTLSNTATLDKWYSGGMESRALGRKLESMQLPIEDQSAPQTVPSDTAVLK